jgi:hypothetical protein
VGIPARRAQFGITAPNQDGNCFIIPLGEDGAPLTSKDSEACRPEGA